MLASGRHIITKTSSRCVYIARYGFSNNTQNRTVRYVAVRIFLFVYYHGGARFLKKQPCIITTAIYTEIHTSYIYICIDNFIFNFSWVSSGSETEKRKQVFYLIFYLISERGKKNSNPLSTVCFQFRRSGKCGSAFSLFYFLCMLIVVPLIVFSCFR